VSIVENELCVSRMWVVVFYISYVFLVPLLNAASCLSYIRCLACMTRKFFYSTLVYFLCMAGLSLFHELLNSIGGFERYNIYNIFGRNYCVLWNILKPVLTILYHKSHTQ